MKVNKKVLAKLESVYAVSPIELDKKVHFLAATEGHGACLLFTPPDWEMSYVWDGPGGTMGIVPFPGTIHAFLAIQKFFPNFQSEHAGIVYAEAEDNIRKPWNVHRVIDLPFVHRFDIIQVGAELFVIAATVCGGKAFPDDWSKPGAVYIGRIPNDSHDVWSIEPILEGLHKNHGMHVTNIGGERVVLIGAKEGLFKIKVPENPRSSWQYKCLIDHEISDIYVSDVDEDGEVEIVTIEPFHGNELVIYKSSGGLWQPVYKTAIDFGHVVWGGEIPGKSGILVGNRGGEKALVRLYLEGYDLRTMDRLDIDKGVGPTQIAVIHEKGRDLIFSANHAVGEVALYEIS